MVLMRKVRLEYLYMVALLAYFALGFIIIVKYTISEVVQNVC